jgi:exodeoxyribonuclease VII small subunit
MTHNRKTPADSEATTFEAALAKLEAIAAELEDGKIGLSEAMLRYEEGIALLKSCDKKLRGAEQRIRVLSGVDSDGNPITEPLEGEPGCLPGQATSNSEPTNREPTDDLPRKAGAGRRRRSRPASGPPAGRQSPAGEAESGDVDEGGHLF